MAPTYLGAHKPRILAWTPTWCNGLLPLLRSITRMAPAIPGLATTIRTQAPHARKAPRLAGHLRHSVIIALAKFLAAVRRRAPALLTDIPTTGAFPMLPLLVRARPEGAGAFMPLLLTGSAGYSRQLVGCTRWSHAALRALLLSRGRRAALEISAIHRRIRRLPRLLTCRPSTAVGSLP